MRFKPDQWTHTGLCPMCGKKTKANVHQQCGLAREAALAATRGERLRFVRSKS